MRISKYVIADELMNRSRTRSPGLKIPVQFCFGPLPLISGVNP